MMKPAGIFLAGLFLFLGLRGQQPVPAAENLEQYLPLLRGKRVAVFANPTSRVGSSHLVDTLLKQQIRIVRIFGPEHGFRGTADAGEKVKDGTDPSTGLPVVSLYGSHQKPTAEDLVDVDVLLFDIQDVGVRFYTFISSLEYCIEACFENKKPLLLLDRPNPNGFYVDGPVLEKAHRSFVGRQPVPVVYGMTIGEYARMLVGERWLSAKACSNHAARSKIKNDSLSGALLQVIPCRQYTHESFYELPVPPSPNLTTIQAIYLYPSTCFFEGTVLSEGRGTDLPFQLFGHPTLPDSLFAFTPRPNAGAKSSKCFYQTCHGWKITGTPESVRKMLNRKLRLSYLLDAYSLFPDKDSFFLKNNFFDKLAGNTQLREQVIARRSEQEIRKSWEPALSRFLAIRKRYLLYPDFR